MYRYNPLSKKSEEILKSPVYVSKISAVNFGKRELQTMEKETMENDEDSKKRAVYVHYVSGDKIIRTNKDNPKDTMERQLKGAAHIRPDPARNKVYYIYYDTFIVEDTLDAEGEKDYVYQGANKLTSLQLDPQKKVLYFSDDDGKVRLKNLETDAEKVLYDRRDIPRVLSLTPKSKDTPQQPKNLLLAEGSGPTAKLYLAPVDGSRKPSLLTQYPAINGNEKSLRFDPERGVYNYVKDEKVFEFDPLTRQVDQSIKESAQLVEPIPRGLLYVTPKNEVKFLHILIHAFLSYHL